jgi:ATP-binding cassette subfamily F protein 3
MISLQKVSYSIRGRQLLDNISFQITNNQHVGLVGRNGTGKSTIFKIIQGQLSVDQGNVEVAKQWKILAVKQEMPEGDITPLNYLLSQDMEAISLFKELENCEDPNRLGDIYERLIQIDAYSAESRAAIVLKGLGFSDEDQNRPLNTFSGGFRMRVALAAVLFQEPDLLLLDEPTNHLDLETTQWLQGFLKKYPKSFLLISHDRDFLNATVTSILHLKNGKVTRYTGNFDTFLTTYQLQQANIAAYNEKLTEQKERMMAFVNRYRAKASRAKQAQSRLKAIEKMNFIPVEKDDPTIAFQFPEPDDLAPPLISFEKVSVGYGEKIILKNLSGTLSPDDRIALVGANGNGKTTFARFLSGNLQAGKGSIHTNRKLKIAFYRQDQFEELETDRSAYAHVSDHLPHANDLQVRSHLGRFGFSKEKAEQKVKELSGGERARLLFACLTAERPNLLILDEPTNHLDMEMRESLITALNAYKGAVVLITHDQHLLHHVADRLWIVKDGTINHFDGDIKEYEKSLLND